MPRPWDWGKSFHILDAPRPKPSACNRDHSLCEHRFGKLLGIESLKIVSLFPQADKFNRQVQFLLYRDHHPTLAGSIEFGDDQAGEGNGFVEFASLIERIHAGGSVEHQQYFMRGARELFADNAMNFLQFL